MRSEIEERAKFNLIRYSQVWEDADLLIDALGIKEGDIVLSIASAGDNAFALLAQNPKKVYGVDLNFEQIACCELRKAMYRQLNHKDHLTFGGVVRGEMDRASVLKNLELPQNIEAYWEHNITLIEKGFMTQGKFEKYFKLFRERALPLVHTHHRIDNLVTSKNADERRNFYDRVWNNRRWKMMFKLFFSRFVMGRLGRDKEFFKFVEGSVADRILARSKHALSELDTSQNPYLQFILYGEYFNAFPYSLREENYDRIKNNLDKIEFHRASVEEFIDNFDSKIDAFNLSDIFEYMTPESMDRIYEELLKKAAEGATLAYWNMLAPRRCSDMLCEKYGVKTSAQQNTEFLMRDKAFFYSRFYLDTVCAAGEHHEVM